MLGVINFVNDEQDGTTTSQGPASGVRVLVDHSGRHVDDQQHQIGRRECRLGLFGDLGLERVAGLEPPSGVDDVKTEAAPLDFDSLAVTGHATVFFDDRHSLTGETVHERALADVRPADDHELGFHTGTRPTRTEVNAARRS